ncbi:MAG: hypothetical protein E7488_00150 [Ruminococcaceae bacterium]|nr:hypothetical protein [Oscillospiraceae bacterium]
MKKQYCIVNFENKKIIDKLKQYGYICIPTEKSACVSEPISLHADVLYLKKGEKEIFVSECQKNNISLLKQLGYSITPVKLMSGYRTECKLNMIITDKSIICNPETCADLSLEDKTKNIINVKQGYTKCATVVMGNENFITEDNGIFNALQNAGKNCLLIEKGYVNLDGYSYGFIGGASVFLSEKNTLLFFGDISAHPDFYKIKKFCEDAGVDTEWINDITITDIGGAVEL